MRTTINIDDALLAGAVRETKLKTKTAVVELGLRLILERAAAQRIIALRGTMPELRTPRRRAGGR